MAKSMEYLIIKGTIADLPKDELQKVDECAAKLRQVLAEFGQAGLIALALVVAEQDG